MAKTKAKKSRAKDLRDEFAMAAIAGMTANASWIAYARGFKNGRGEAVEFAYSATAIEAYRIADAMMEQRDSENEQ
jgi:hypothetical protein